MTDKEKVLKVLKQNRRWLRHVSICKMVKPGAICMAVGQQISKLRKLGYIIDSRIEKNGKMAEYRYMGRELPMPF